MMFHRALRLQEEMRDMTQKTTGGQCLGIGEAYAERAQGGNDGRKA
jgi:hypothetical protein